MSSLRLTSPYSRKKKLFPEQRVPVRALLGLSFICHIFIIIIIIIIIFQAGMATNPTI